MVSTPQNKKILITGGAGFIGSHLCERLLKDGHKVICLDNFFTGSIENISHLFDNPDFKVIPHDITEPIILHERVDEIYNLACPASPVHYQHDPIKTVKANTAGVIHMLELAKLHQAKILQASTSEIYGDPLEHPQGESYRGNVNPIGPRACYDEGKRVAETLFFDYHREHSVPIRVARISNTYGPRMALNDGRVISNFIIQALKNKPLIIYGQGSQTRSFCYIDDLIEALVSLVEHQDFTGPVNLGNPNYEFTMLDLAKLVIELTDSKSQIEFGPLPQDDPVKRRLDIALAKEKLNWEPKTSLENGLRKTIEYFKNILKI